MVTKQILSKQALAAGLKIEQEREYQSLSPFEVTDILEKLAAEACQNSGPDKILNSGRGNPNFLNVLVRKAFARLSFFAAEEANHQSDKNCLGFRPQKEGIWDRLEEFLRNADNEESRFLQEALFLAEENLKIKAEDLAFELTDAILGDYYPVPPRIFPQTEKIVNAYLEQVLLSTKRPAGQFKLFATEGATEAMLYSFKSLRVNRLLHKGDRVATITPIFAPYLELPLLEDYNLINIEIKEEEALGWQIPVGELKKLEDKSIKVLYMVNPTNPTSVGIQRETIDQLARLVKEKRQDLIILTDTVYATFVEDFYSLVSLIPENTLCIYSYSKYFGVTGWRLGVIMLHENNVIDRLIGQLPAEIKDELNERYSIISSQPEKIPFIERLELDSRDVALAHTGGLSGPQQTIMALFSLYNLLDNEKDYKKSIEDTLELRIKNLYHYFPAELSYLRGSNKTHYYALIDILKLAEKAYGLDFAKYLEGSFLSIDFILKLAAEQAIICLPGAGFGGPDWSMRVSLANLYNDDYLDISKAIMDTMAVYYRVFKN